MKRKNQVKRGIAPWWIGCFIVLMACQPREKKQFLLEKSLVVSFGSPYYYGIYKHAHVYINAYTEGNLSQDLVVKALFGEIHFEGKSPVNLDIHKAFKWP